MDVRQRLHPATVKNRSGVTAKSLQRHRSGILIAVASALLVVTVGGVSWLTLTGSRERGPKPGDRFATLSESIATQASTTATGDELDAALYLAAQPTAYWLVPERDVIGEVGARVAALAGEARRQDAILVLVVYGVPGRDCGSHSAGGLDSTRYVTWIDEIAGSLQAAADVSVALVLEPDSLAQVSSCSGKDERVAVLQRAVTALQRDRTWVYLDGGNSQWHSASQAAALLREVGLEHVRGFALNVSNFVDTADEVAYAHEIVAALDAEGARGVHAVIDTSRNGAGAAASGQWCNPPGRRVGAAAGSFGDHVVDTNLWIKPPGESDGLCNGGPAAGLWWPRAAIELTLDVRP